MLKAAFARMRVPQLYHHNRYQQSARQRVPQRVHLSLLPIQRHVLSCLGSPCSRAKPAQNMSSMKPNQNPTGKDWGEMRTPSLIKSPPLKGGWGVEP